MRQLELRRHSSGRPGPLAAYNELVKKAELKPGDLAQVCSQPSFLFLTLGLMVDRLANPNKLGGRSHFPHNFGDHYVYIIHKQSERSLLNIIILGRP